MTVTFNNDNFVIVYALGKIISFARDNQYIFLATSIWSISLIIGLQSELIRYMDNWHSLSKKIEVRCEITALLSTNLTGSESSRQDTILKECEEYLRNSKWLRELANVKSSGRTRTGCIKLLKSTTKALQRKQKERNYSKTEGIELDEIEWRKSLGECLCCAWPSARKGGHQVKERKGPITLDMGTTSYPTRKSYYPKTQLHSDHNRS